MEIYLNKRAVRQIRQSALDAIEDGDTDALREDIVNSFGDEEIDEIEKVLGSGDIQELIEEIVNAWNLEDVDELMELLEEAFTETGTDLTLANPEDEDEEDEDDEEDEEDEDDGTLMFDEEEF
jgi:trans-2-enoyl-CoA reductase